MRVPEIYDEDTEEVPRDELLRQIARHNAALDELTASDLEPLDLDDGSLEGPAPAPVTSRASARLMRTVVSFWG
jgi:hypothetical protein